MTETPFTDRIEEIASDFLQTVVVVDDQAIDHGEGADAAHRLDTRVLINAFADRGLVCGVIDPEDEETAEEVAERVSKAARRSDLLVLDWKMGLKAGAGPGDIAVEVISKVLGQAENTSRRLRLVAIYTGDGALETFIVRVGDELKAREHYKECPLETDDFCVTKGPLRVVAFAKPETRVRAGAEQRVVAFDELPARLTHEFARFTRGIARGVALSSLAALREDSHRLLHVIPEDVDPGFLGDRTRLPIPSDAEAQLLDIVTGELQSILEDNQVTEIAELANLELWIQERLADGPMGTALPGHENDGLEEAQLRHLLEHGGLEGRLGIEAATDAGVKLPKGRKAAVALGSAAFSSIAEDAVKADALYGERVMTRSRYGNPAPMLTLGAVVERGEGEHPRHLLCMQPECDSVRLTQVTSFPFLPLVEVGPDAGADLALGDLRLRIKYPPSGIVLLAFAPAEDEVVRAKCLDKRFLFETDGPEGEVIEWLCQLRPSFAQRAAHELGEQLSRVAVNEPEFLRVSKRQS